MINCRKHEKTSFHRGTYKYEIYWIQKLCSSVPVYHNLANTHMHVSWKSSSGEALEGEIVSSQAQKGCKYGLIVKHSKERKVLCTLWSTENSQRKILRPVVFYYGLVSLYITSKYGDLLSWSYFKTLCSFIDLFQCLLQLNSLDYHQRSVM